MNRAKRLYILLGILAAVCIVTFAVSRYETRKEDIKASGEVVFTIDPDAVTALSWEQGSSSLAFSLSDGIWQYGGDAAFPVDADKIAERLDAFVDFAAAYVIDDVTDYAQYGLEDPECTVYITTGEGTAAIALGAYSTMDAQRYVSTGDGKVYLAVSDPMELFSTELSRMIKNDVTPDIDRADCISFTGENEYTVIYDGSGEESICADDVYFSDGRPLDTVRVEDYLRTIASLGLSDYATYTADEDKLSFYGLDSPVLTVTLDYTDDDGADKSFTLAVSKNAQELAAAEKNDEDTAEVQAYARVGDSAIVYKISSESYDSLVASGYDDLRHREIFTADFSDVTAITAALDGETYSFELRADEDSKKLLSDVENVWYYGEDKIDAAALEDALVSLLAESFTDEKPSGKCEIALTLTLDNERFPELDIALYRHDGSSCIAVVDGETIGLVPRGEAVSLIEAVNAIVLGASGDTSDS